MAILVDKHDVSLVDKDYHFYLDTSDESLKKGFFSKKYDPLDHDYFEKKFPGLAKNRNQTVERYLIPISKNDDEKIKILSERLDYRISTTKQDTKVIYESEILIVTDYTEKSIAIFFKPDIKDPDRLSIMDLMEEFTAKRVANLTGPTGSKLTGYVYAKSSKKLESLLDRLRNIKKEILPDKDGIANMEDHKDGSRRIRVWGSADFVSSQLEDMREEFSIETENVSSDGRKDLILKER